MFEVGVQGLDGDLEFTGSHDEVSLGTMGEERLKPVLEALRDAPEASSDQCPASVYLRLDDRHLSLIAHDEQIHYFDDDAGEEVQIGGVKATLRHVQAWAGGEAAPPEDEGPAEEAPARTRRIVAAKKAKKKKPKTAKKAKGSSKTGGKRVVVLKTEEPSGGGWGKAAFGLVLIGLVGLGLKFGTLAEGFGKPSWARAPDAATLGDATDEVRAALERGDLREAQAALDALEADLEGTKPDSVEAFRDELLELRYELILRTPPGGLE